MAEPVIDERDEVPRRTQRVRILRGVVAGKRTRVAGEVCDVSMTDAFTLCGAPSGAGAGFIPSAERVSADTPLGVPKVAREKRGAA